MFHFLKDHWRSGIGSHEGELAAPGDLNFVTIIEGMAS